jgi:hypothetical protein
MKVNGLKTDFAPVRTEGTQIVICYGLNQVEGDLYEWHEIYLPKTQNANLSLDIVKTAILGDINSRTDEKILSGLVWTPAAGGDHIPVWLSQENQFNFKAAYDLAVQTQGATLPVTFKLGEQEDGTPVYHTFETMEDSTDFYTAAVNHIHQSVADGWLEKDGIDWSPYEALFPEQTKTETTE